MNGRPGFGTPAVSLDRGAPPFTRSSTGAQVMHVGWHVDSQYRLVHRRRMGVTVFEIAVQGDLVARTRSCLRAVRWVSHLLRRGLWASWQWVP